MAILELRDVGFEVGGQRILEGLSFSIERGDFVLLKGPSGSGKSTLLKLLNNLISASEGSILYKGKEIESYDPIDLRREISYCLQTPVLFGDVVREDMEFVFKSRGQAYQEEKVSEVMEYFQLSEGYLDKEVMNLSGGEKQRLALVRSLLFMPEVLLLDEVTSALDETNASIVEGAIKLLNQKGITVIWISHQVKRHEPLANKIIGLKGGKLDEMEVY